MDNNNRTALPSTEVKRLTVDEWEDLARKEHERMSREEKRARRQEWRDNTVSHARRS